MLFTPPTPALEAVHPSVVTATLARVPELGLFSYHDDAERSGQHTATSLATDVRTAPGWLSARRPVTFMAGRKKSLGTELLSLFESMVRAAPGWVSARPSHDSRVL